MSEVGVSRSLVLTRPTRIEYNQNRGSNWDRITIWQYVERGGKALTIQLERLDHSSLVSIFRNP